MTPRLSREILGYPTFLRSDQYCLRVLLFLLIPALRSLRQATHLQKVQRRLGVGRTSLSRTLWG